MAASFKVVSSGLWAEQDKVFALGLTAPGVGDVVGATAVAEMCANIGAGDEAEAVAVGM